MSDRPMNDLELLEEAYVVIANAHGGRWLDASEDWRDAAARFRDRYHERLALSRPVSRDTPRERPETGTCPHGLVLCYECNHGAPTTRLSVPASPRETPKAERGRCTVCGWSFGHEVGCPTVQHRPTTLHPLITAEVLERAFAAAEAHWQAVLHRDDRKSATTIRAFVWAAAPALIAPLVDRIRELETR